MATSHISGAADIVYTPLGGTETVHDLAIPLLVTQAAGFMSRRRKRRWDVWNDDFTVREVFTLGSTAVDEIVATIRMDDEPAELRSLLEEALENNVTINYRPDGVTSYPCKVVRIIGAGEDAIVLQPDRDRGGYGEWEVTVLLRRVDGSTFEGLL